MMVKALAFAILVALTPALSWAQVDKKISGAVLADKRELIETNNAKYAIRKINIKTKGGDAKGDDIIAAYAEGLLVLKDTGKAEAANKLRWELDINVYEPRLDEYGNLYYEKLLGLRTNSTEYDKIDFDAFDKFRLMDFMQVLTISEFGKDYVMDICRVAELRRRVRMFCDKVASVKN